jgi:hypothetical protein
MGGFDESDQKAQSSYWLTDPSVPDPIIQAAGADLYAAFC